MSTVHRFQVYEGERLATAFVSVPGIETVDPILDQMKGLVPMVGPIACSAAFNEDRKALQLQFVNYPRAKYGNRGQDDIERVATEVAYRTRGTLEVPEPHKVMQLANGIVTMGLRFGYDGGEKSAELAKEEIAQKSPNKIFARDTEVVSLSMSSVYREPALELHYRLRSDLPILTQLAHDYQQERFSLVLPRQQRVFMIETEHCQDPDTELPSVVLSKMNLLPYVYREKIFPRPVDSPPEE